MLSLHPRPHLPLLVSLVCFVLLITPVMAASRQISTDPDVMDLALTRDGRYALYLANPRLDGAALYRADTRSGAVQRLSVPLIDGRMVRRTWLNTDMAARAIYLVAPAGAGNYGDDLLSVPVSGGETVRLSLPPTASDVIGEDVTLSPDGQAVFFRQNGSLYRALLTGGAPLLLSSGVPARAFVFDYAISASGQHVAFTIGNTLDGLDLYTAPADGSTAAVQVSGARGVNRGVRTQGFAPGYAFTDDGSRMLYMAREIDDSADQLYSVPIDGSRPSAPRLRLSDPGLGVSRLLVSVAGRVVFRAGESDDGPSDLFSAPVDGATPTIVLSGGLRANQGRVPDFMLSPDGATVLYAALSTNLTTTAILSSVPVAGATAAAPHNTLGQILRWQLVVTPNSSTVLFPGLDRGLYAVPMHGGAVPELRMAPLFARTQLRHLELTPAGDAALLIATYDDDARSVLYRVPFSGKAAATLLSDLVVHTHVALIALTPTVNMVAFSADGATAGGTGVFLADLPVIDPAKMTHRVYLPLTR